MESESHLGGCTVSAVWKGLRPQFKPSARQRAELETQLSRLTAHTDP